MSRLFMFAIAALYFCAFVAALFEKRWAWCVLLFCWAVGSLAAPYVK